MKSLSERTADSQYQDLMRSVLKNGTRTQSQQGVDAMTLIAPMSLHFKLANGFPILNERSLNPKRASDSKSVAVWQQAIGEILGFINGARTQAKLEKFGCHWWRHWVTKEKCEKRGFEEGDLGDGSYGAAFHDFPTVEGGTYNQFKNIIEQIKEYPHLRTHFISPWIPQYTIRGNGKRQRVVVAPCHGWIHIRIIDNKLTLHMFQRSCDIPLGLPQNLIQYAALTMAIAQITGFEAYEYIHSFSDAHIYVDQIPAVEEMLAREPKRLATMSIDPNIKDLFDFRIEHFTLSDYDPHPAIKGIPVAI